MAIAKVVYKSSASATPVTWMDVTQKTVAAANLLSGETALKNDGTDIVGTLTPGGGSSGNINDPIRFFDYDGTLVASYTAVPSSLPSVPTHTGLTSGTWNYTLQQITTQFNTMGSCDIGANYSTVSGKTEIDVEFIDDTRLSPYLGIAPDGTVTIDWGDGTATTDVTGISVATQIQTQHTYAQTGQYTITLTATSGTYALYGTSTYPLLNKNSTSSSANIVYSNCVKKARIGSSCFIGAYAFYSCYSLSSITIPSGVTSIGIYAFRYCYSLSSITIPSGVTSIRGYAFGSCSSLSSITIPSGVTSIGEYAFAGCSSLSSITIPSGVTSIGSYAFNNCSFSSITIPSGVTSISVYAFRNCYSLSSITIPSGVTSIGAYAFYGCSSLSSITIPSGVTSIGDYAFYGCYSLSSITIPSGVTSIGNSAFRGCYSLSSITIPSGVTSISSYAFYQCYTISSITIPSGVTSIEGNAFNNCYGVAEYHLKPTTPPTLANTNAFTNIQPECIICVPYSADHSVLNAYKTASNWSTYADYMQEEPA